MTRRRQFLVLGAALAVPFRSDGQQASRVRRVGFLAGRSQSTPSNPDLFYDAFVDQLRKLGYEEGKNLAIEWRFADGKYERLPQLASELVKANVEVIVTHSSPGTRAAQRATTTTPIVMTAVGDPIGGGFARSLARPGGNITGLSIQQTDLAGKRLEILREAFPGLRTLGIVANSGSASAVMEMRETEAAASKYGLDVVKSEIRSLDDLEAAIEAFKGRAEALYFCPDPLLTTNRRRVVTLALGARLPAMFGFREYVEAGGLMSYGPNFPDLFRRAAEYVDKILRGVKPSDLPVEQPTKFDLVINSTTAKALGLKISEAYLLRANEVIE